MIRIGVDRIGIEEAGRRRGNLPKDVCPDDGLQAVFRGMALVCPRCGKLLGGM